MTGLVPINLSDPDVRTDMMVELGRRGISYSVDRNGLVYVPQDRAQTAGVIAGGIVLAHEVGGGEEVGVFPDGSYASDVRGDEGPAHAAVRRSRQSLGIGGRPKLPREGRKAGFGLYRDTREFLEDPDAYGAIMLEQPEPPTVETPHEVHYQGQVPDPTILYSRLFVSRGFERAQRAHEEREKRLAIETAKREKELARAATSDRRLQRFYEGFFDGRQFRKAQHRILAAERAVDDHDFNAGPQEEQEADDSAFEREQRVVGTILDLTRYI